MPESWEDFVDWAIDFVEQRFSVASPEDEFADVALTDTVSISAFKTRYDWARECTEICVRWVDVNGRRAWNALLYPRDEPGVGQRHAPWRASAWRASRF